jgi:hypothetical protein
MIPSKHEIRSVLCSSVSQRTDSSYCPKSRFEAPVTIPINGKPTLKELWEKDQARKRDNDINRTKAKSDRPQWMLPETTSYSSINPGTFMQSPTASVAELRRRDVSDSPNVNASLHNSSSFRRSSLLNPLS